jgi:NAD kinase
MKEKNENKSEKKEYKKKAAERKAEMKKAAERNEILLSNLQVKSLKNEIEILKVKNEILDVLRTDGRFIGTGTGSTPVADAAAGVSALAHD